MSCRPLDEQHVGSVSTLAEQHEHRRLTAAVVGRQEPRSLGDRCRRAGQARQPRRQAVPYGAGITTLPSECRSRGQPTGCRRPLGRRSDGARVTARPSPASPRRPGRSAPPRRTGTAAPPGRRRTRACARGSAGGRGRSCGGDSSVHSLRGNSAPTSASTLHRVAAASVQPNRRASRPKCVSTVMPGHPERVAEHDVRRLAADPGQRHQVLQPAGHLAAVALAQRLGPARSATSSCSGRSRSTGSAPRARARSARGVVGRASR